MINSGWPELIKLLTTIVIFCGHQSGLTSGILLQKYALSMLPNPN
jgi:hypothetical protein